MLFSKSLVAIFGGFILCVTAQGTLDASGCLGNSGITTFAACNSLYSQITYCAGPQVASGSAYVSCYCNQQLFNGFFDCLNEQNRCLGENENDAGYMSAIGAWHSVCDNRISFTPTTPVVTSLTSTYNQEYCNSLVASACYSGTSLLSQCRISYGSTASLYSSCLCQPKALSLEYTCIYLGNISCFGKPGVLSAIPLYTFCHEATSVLMSLNATYATMTASATSLVSPAVSSGNVSSPSITRPALPGSTTTGTGVVSTSSSSSVANIIDKPLSKIGLVIGTMVIWQLGWNIS